MTHHHKKKKDENLIHQHQNVDEHEYQHPMMSNETIHTNNSIIFNLNQLQNNQSLPLSAASSPGMSGNNLTYPFVPPKDPTHYHQAPTHIPESMIFAETFDEER